MIDLIDIKVFLQAADSGSFSSAARHFGLPPSSISRRIKSIEDHLGIPLFVRNTRHLALTEAGQSYATTVRQVLESLDAANRSVDRFRDTPRGTLNVVSRVSLGSRLIAPLLPRFQRQHPEININLHLTSQQIMTLPEGSDIAIRFGLAPPSALLTRRVGHVSQSIYASPAYIAERGEPLAPQDLYDHNCLAFVTNDEPAVWRLEGEGTTHQIRIPGNLRSNDVSALLAVTRTGAGISVFHDFVTQELMERGELVKVLGDYAVSTMATFDTNIYLMFAQNMKDTLPVRLFTDFLVANLKSHE